MSDTFGAWLLKQGERTDSIGSMSRSWRQLKEARGYKHSQEKSVRELLSATFGEDWAQMQGDAVMDAAVAEWRGDFDKPAADDAAPGQGTIFDLPQAAQQYLGGEAGEQPLAPVQRVGGPVILVINGADVELPPGRYTLAIVVQPAEVDAQEFADAVAEAFASGPLDWDALFRSADFTAPE